MQSLGALSASVQMSAAPGVHEVPESLHSAHTRSSLTGAGDREVGEGETWGLPSESFHSTSPSHSHAKKCNVVARAHTMKERFRETVPAREV